MRSIHIIVLALTALAVISEAAQRHQCKTGGDYTDGCSFPFRVKFPYQDEFTGSCHIHDVCYRCGSDYGISRDVCDLKFYYGMAEECGVKGEEEENCEGTADLYYNAVSIFGFIHYKEETLSYCDQDWVEKCIRQR